MKPWPIIRFVSIIALLTVAIYQLGWGVIPLWLAVGIAMVKWEGGK